jgi:hypothetical protein
MMTRSYGSVMIVLLVLGLSSAAIWMAGEALGDSPQELLARAEEAFAERFIEERMREAISYYEAVLPYFDQLMVQSRAFVLDRLSQCYMS